MNESSNNLNAISENLTKPEFEGFCKGMATNWILKALNANGDNSSLGKRVKFWDKAYERYKHNCKP